MNWNKLTSLSELNIIDKLSTEKKVVILKHSIRCSISVAALGRIERKWEPQGGDNFHWYYLDLINHRDISNAIAQRYQVRHESPQVLVIENGKCVYHESHYGVQYEEILIQQ